ncbi:MAG TPA: ABC transporter ATP-binding protein [Desulfatiglandales bacterium]|nr:ABC transporter ATP-binding protein [Desulfatiglandales bacterium]
MLEIDKIDVSYGDVQALWQISLKVEDKEIVALIGSNGAGKSTVLKSVSGLIKPRKGTINYDGIRLEKQPAQKIVEIGICMVPEGRRLFPDMSVLENLELGAYLGRSRRAKDETLNWVYEIFPILKERTGQPARTLSGGEQQMLAIARALMAHPKLLLLDEISLGLSPVLVETIYGVIKRISDSRRITILAVEQNVSVILELANRAYIIENGRIVGQGDAKALLESGEVKHAYLGITPASGEAE